MHAFSTVLVVLALCGVAEAQSAPRPLAVAKPWQEVTDCAQPSLPANLSLRLTASTDDRIVWCVEATTAVATASDYAVYVDGVKILIALKACVSSLPPTQVQCSANLPMQAVQVLNTGPGMLHKVTLTRTFAGVESPQSAVLTFETAGCPYTPPGGVSSVRPVGAAIGGQTSNGAQANAERIGQLRRDGWRVEGHPAVQAGVFIILAWCVGTGGQ